jgi:hypothetical protein
MPVADLARKAARQTAGVAASARWTLPGASRVPDQPAVSAIHLLESQGSPRDIRTRRMSTDNG